MIFGEWLSAPCFLRGCGQGSIGPEGVCGGKTKGQERQRGHVQRAVVGVPVGHVGLTACEAYGEESAVVEVFFAVKHVVHHRCKGTAHLAGGKAFGQFVVPGHKRQGLHGGHTVRYRATKYGEGAFGRDKTFENNAELACALEGTVVVLAVVYAGVAARVLHSLKGFEVHGMEHVAAVVVEGEEGTVGIPTVAGIPFLNLAYGRVYTVFVGIGVNLGKEAFDNCREKHPVGVGRIHAAQLCEFLDVAFLVVSSRGTQS